MFLYVSSFLKGNKLGATSFSIRSSKSSPVTSSMAAEQPGVCAENGVQSGKILTAIDDDFNGVIVEMKEAMNPMVFHSMLKASLSQWKHQVVSISDHQNSVPTKK